jgi:hypothetical protein
MPAYHFGGVEHDEWVKEMKAKDAARLEKYKTTDPGETPVFRKWTNHLKSTACKYLPIKQRKFCLDHQLSRKARSLHKKTYRAQGGKRSRRKIK